MSSKKSKDKGYYGAVGRRKTSNAHVRFFPNQPGEVTINGISAQKYFPYFEWLDAALAPLRESSLLESSTVTVIVKGGGKRSQAEAVRHGIARALVSYEEGFKKALRAAGYLTRDSRMKERKKPGLKRARRAPQWSKR